MSYDFKLKNICNHLVIDEIHQISDDRQSIYLDVPPSATYANQVQIKINGEYINPNDSGQYAYQLIRDETYFVPVALQRPAIAHKKKIFFKKKLKRKDDIFEISYYTDSVNCRRCHGVNIEDDFKFNQQGKIIIIENQQKLIQHVHKFVFTILGSNPFHELIGTNLFNLIGSKISNFDLLTLRLQEDLITTLQIYIERQISQASTQEVTDAEFLYKIESINIEQNINDPTIISVTIILINRSFGQAIISEDIVLPQYNSQQFFDVRSFGLSERDANNTGLDIFGQSPVRNFRSIP